MPAAEPAELVADSPAREDAADRLASALERITAARRALTQDIATRHGLSALQVEIVRQLATVRASGSTSLAAALGVTVPTISDAVGSLRRKGLIGHVQDVDARARTVELTSAGVSTYEEIENELAPFRRACAAAGPDALGDALAIIGGLWREGLLSIDRSCATCRHFSTAPGEQRCGLLNVELTAANLRVTCPEHEAA